MRTNLTPRLTVAAMVMMAASVLVLPEPAGAQSSSSGAIAGSVTDSSGAPLPGVTVEAASPELIEKVRTAVTDGRGEYKIVDLRPGSYAVTFSLVGFRTVRREGLELNTGVTLPVNGEMSIGSLEETITVTGASPVVDVQNSRTQYVMTRDVLDALPTGKTIQGFASLTLGALPRQGTQDVGGNKGEQTSDITIHNSRGGDGRLLMDGMSFGSSFSGGGQGARSFLLNQISVQEITLTTGGADAESETAGANLNVVPRQGSNEFRGIFQSSGSGPALQGTNLTDDLRARGLSTGQEIKKIWDYGIGIGGPIVRNRLWFFTGHRSWGAQEYAPGNYFNAAQGSLFYTPDLKRPAYTDTRDRAHDLRITWQATTSHQFVFSETYEDNCLCFARVDISNVSPEAAINSHLHNVHLVQAVWNNVATNRLLFQGGYTFMYNGRIQRHSPGVSDTDIPIVEQSTGYAYNAQAGGIGATSYGKPLHPQMNGRFAVSYITGSHAMKAGFTWIWNDYNEDAVLNNPPISYVFRKPTPDAQPLPVSLTQYASPHHSTSRSLAYGFYAQDQWTVRNLTLNGGLRIDYQRGYIPAQTRPAGVFTPAIEIAAINNVPNWKDINPRVGAVYDLFGNGKSALKFSTGRFILADYTATTAALNPAAAVVTSATPDCDLTNTALNGECGPLSANGFGTTRISTTYADDVLRGWGVRPNSWQTVVSFQHELRPGMAATIGYYRTSYGNFRVTQNQAVTPADFSSYCIKVPTDSRLSGLDGRDVCGFYDVSVAKFGAMENIIKRASDFGKQSEVYNGVDIGMNARFQKGGLITGGVSLGKTVTDTCEIATAYPNVSASMTPAVGTVAVNNNTPTDFCHVEVPWVAGTQVKFAAAYPLPWSLQASLTYQNLPGSFVNSSYVATNAEIARSLGRNLGSCGTAAVCTATRTLTNALTAPFSESEARFNQLDVRLTKGINVGRFKAKAMFDAYNVFNTATIITQNTTYSTTNTYLRPTSILSARLFKFGVDLLF
jgi:hypothetical protein